MTPVSRISAAFAPKSSRRAALMPYFTLGYPDRATSLAVVEAIAPYSDLLELGVPFSDPLADGPTIQHSTQVALEQGVTSRACLDMVRELRRRGVTPPILLLGYYNPILAYGEAAYARDAAAAGVDGLIVPDLPPEEADSLVTALTAEGLVLIHFLAPTSSPDRVRTVLRQAQGFIYMVSVTGVTGARAQVSANLEQFVRQVRAQTDIPLAVGFGVSTPAQAGQIGQFADGVIVGSALINAVDVAADKPAAAVQFVQTLAAGLSKPTTHQQPPTEN
ncbi:MAG: tryptophan synthase subunit alpha [Anaerolineales bacterium]|nr:tryptophan synthase subunit alpha [Anaerolineales bacterium]MCB8950943.1 tryptophan synthase subunit alpha [Ardenticatenales bacterium]